MSSPQRFANKRALITGATKGIGRAIALQLAQEGAQVVALGRSRSDLESLKQEHPNIVELVCVDLEDVQATKNTLSQITPVDLLVNNAGMAVLQPFLDTDPDIFDKTMAVNVRSIVLVSQIFARHMVESGKGGVIVNVSSQGGIRPLRDHTAYCASKAAVDHLTRTMALELGPHNIRVNSVNPTVVMTDMGRMAWSDEEKSGPMLSRIPLKRFAEVSDVVGPVLFLLSNESAMVTGITLPVDGGFCAV